MKKKNFNEHNIIPKHEKLTEKQKQEILKQYMCTIEDLPKIKITDAAIKDLGPKHDDIFRIYRTSRTEGTSIFYRRVVNE